MSKICSYPECTNYPVYSNLKNTKGTRCFQHNKDFPYVENIKYCIENNCIHVAYYGKTKFSSTHCVKHKKKDFVIIEENEFDKYDKIYEFRKMKNFNNF